MLKIIVIYTNIIIGGVLCCTVYLQYICTMSLAVISTHKTKHHYVHLIQTDGRYPIAHKESYYVWIKLESGMPRYMLTLPAVYIYLDASIQYKFDGFHACCMLFASEHTTPFTSLTNVCYSLIECTFIQIVCVRVCVDAHVCPKQIGFTESNKNEYNRMKWGIQMILRLCLALGLIKSKQMFNLKSNTEY